MTTGPALERSDRALLDAATQLLVERPTLSLAELASAIGVGRTTLHRRFPTRADLLRAIARDAVAQLRLVYQESGMEDVGARRGRPRAADGAAVLAAFDEVVVRLVPLGPRIMFLLRAPELDDDPELTRQVEDVDALLLGAVERGQRAGALDPSMSPRWVVESMYALVYAAWEQVALGALAARDAAPLVLRTWRSGVEPRSAGDVPRR